MWMCWMALVVSLNKKMDSGLQQHFKQQPYDLFMSTLVLHLTSGSC